jgi:hypothetical protein
MVSVRIDFRKRDFGWVGLVVVLLGIGLVFAYNSNMDAGTPSTMGHSAGEMDVDVDGDGVADKSLQAAIDAGDIGGEAVTCQSFSGSGSGSFELPPDGAGNRFLISSDIASVTRRCVEFGYDWGYVTNTFSWYDWCRYSNARTARWADGAWQLGSCENYNVRSAMCCNFN